jgi:hypothetical protein
VSVCACVFVKEREFVCMCVYVCVRALQLSVSFAVVCMRCVHCASCTLFMWAGLVVGRGGWEGWVGNPNTVFAWPFSHV